MKHKSYIELSIKADKIAPLHWQNKSYVNAQQLATTE